MFSNKLFGFEFDFDFFDVIDAVVGAHVFLHYSNHF